MLGLGIDWIVDYRAIEFAASKYFSLVCLSDSELVGPCELDQGAKGFGPYGVLVSGGYSKTLKNDSYDIVIQKFCWFS